MSSTSSWSHCRRQRSRSAGKATGWCWRPVCCCCARACCCRSRRSRTQRPRKTSCAIVSSHCRRRRHVAAWLDQRPQLGHEVFARGQPELLSASTAHQYEVDVIEFLWACAAQFDDDAAPVDIATVYRPSWHDLYSVLDARTHILRLLASDHLPLERFLPDLPSEDGAKLALWRRSAVASTLMAGLELARDGVVIGAGMDVTLVGPLPTPAIALLTRSLRADLGVMISASHNPYEDNGIKLFGPDGFKLSDATELEIEALMRAQRQQAHVRSRGLPTAGRRRPNRSFSNETDGNGGQGACGSEFRTR